MPDIKYVQLESSKFIVDEDFQYMTDAERGIYSTIIFYMLANDGRIRNDLKRIKHLCNSNDSFETKWENVRSKFYAKSVWLRHRKVDSVLREAKKRQQIASNKGLAGAKARWHRQCNSQESAIAKRNEAKSKRSKVNISTSTVQTSAASSSLRLRQAIEKLPGLTARTQGDRTAYANLCAWLVGKVQNGEFEEEVYVRVFGYAREVAENRNAQNKKAVFFTTLKRELGYRPKK